MYFFLIKKKDIKYLNIKIVEILMRFDVSGQQERKFIDSSY